MKVRGTIKRIMDVTNGTSSSGKEWYKQTFVLEYEGGQYPKSIAIDVFSLERIQQFALRVGEDVEVSFDVEAREYNEKLYNSITAWKVERPAMQQPTQPMMQQVAQPIYQQPAPMMQQPTAQPTSQQAELFTAPKKDGLPF